MCVTKHPSSLSFMLISFLTQLCSYHLCSLITGASVKSENSDEISVSMMNLDLFFQATFLLSTMVNHQWTTIFGIIDNVSNFFQASNMQIQAKVDLCMAANWCWSEGLHSFRSIRGHLDVGDFGFFSPGKKHVPPKRLPWTLWNGCCKPTRVSVVLSKLDYNPYISRL